MPIIGRYWAFSSAARLRLHPPAPVMGRVGGIQFPPCVWMIMWGGFRGPKSAMGEFQTKLRLTWGGLCHYVMPYASAIFRSGSLQDLASASAPIPVWIDKDWGGARGAQRAQPPFSIVLFISPVFIWSRSVSPILF